MSTPFVLVLHAHLPYVHHPEGERFLEEEWYFEALTETYLPLINAFEALARDGVPFRVTMSLTPPLLSMLAHPGLMQRARNYIGERLAALEGEIKRTLGDPELHPTVLWYREHFTTLLRQLSEGPTPVERLSALAASAHLQLLTCPATHGFLPLLRMDDEAVSAQIRQGVATHRRLLGIDPEGIWLSECAYHPGVERFLREVGIDHAMVEDTTVTAAQPPFDGPLLPTRTPGGLTVIPRDPELSALVWSAKGGYPGDPLFREFYRDAGFDVDMPHIRAMHHSPQPSFTGLKYHRITGDTPHKQIWHPGRARKRAAEHATHFLDRLRARSDEPVLTVSFDAELFGHWWFEGPWWLEALLRKMAADQHQVTACHARDVARRSDAPVRQPPISSWGKNGTCEVWLNIGNDWIYRHLHRGVRRLSAATRKTVVGSEPQGRWLRQGWRELLLAQSSDWAFIMTTNTSVEYAVNRTQVALNRLDRLLAPFEGNDPPEEGWLVEIERQDDIFPDLDPWSLLP